MPHFTDETWADFVRGTATRETSAMIESHLASGCADCKNTLETWRQVKQFSTTESAYAPPYDLVQHVKRQFALVQPPKASATCVLARLVFDTFAQLAPAAIRSAGVTTRQMIYEGEGLIIDLRFERQPPLRKTAIVGQVLRSRPTRGGAAGMPVLLVDEELRPMDHVKTNDFGEFHFEFEAKGPLKVAIQVDSTRTIHIPLDGLHDPATRNVSEK